VSWGTTNQPTPSYPPESSWWVRLLRKWEPHPASVFQKIVGGVGQMETKPWHTRLGGLVEVDVNLPIWQSRIWLKSKVNLVMKLRKLYSIKMPDPQTWVVCVR